MLCTYCDAVKTPAALYNFRCPDCGRPTPKVLTGREMQLVSIGLVPPEAGIPATPLRDENGKQAMTEQKQHRWRHVPHQHRGPHQHKGAADHTHSPKLHNGTFKSQGIATFMGAPYCPPDRNAIQAMGRRCVSSACRRIRDRWCAPAPRKVLQASARPRLNIFRTCSSTTSMCSPSLGSSIAATSPSSPATTKSRTNTSIYHSAPAWRRKGRAVRRRSFGADPGARALSDFHKTGRIGYLHVDCHLDAAPDWAGNAFTNCSGPSRALDLPNCNAKNMVHMGSRNGLNQLTARLLRRQRGAADPVQELVSRGVVDCTREIFTRAWDGTDGVYFSWDTDSIDSSCMPGTTAPECFGLSGRRLFNLLVPRACSAPTSWRFRALSQIRREPDQYQDRGADDHAFPRKQGEDPCATAANNLKRCNEKSETP